MTSLPSPSTENQCSDIVTDAAILSKNDDVSSEHTETDDDNEEEEEEEDEEGDMDFNPLLKEALSIEASSSLSSEIEECEFDGDVADSGEYHSPVADFTNAPNEFPDDAVGNANHGQQMAMQAAKENERNIATNRVNDVTVAEEGRDSDDEDAIWKRTRARYSLVGSTLDELETFLQETDDEDDLHHNIDDEEEYRKFLAAVLLDGDETSGAAPENENVDEESDNDADFELELEEALGSDGDDILPSVSEEGEHGRRPETRQEKRQKTDTRHYMFSGQTNRHRPILPIPNAPISPPHARIYVNGGTSSAQNYRGAFTPQQIGQLHCLMYEHVQLLVQVFSLSVLEPSKQHISTQVRMLLSEMLQKRERVLASQRIPYPSSWFSLPYIYPAITVQNTSESSTVSGGVPFFWVPSVGDSVLSVMDVAPLSLVQSYMDDVSIAVREHRRRQLEATDEGIVSKECLFPFRGLHSTAEASGVSSDPSTPVRDKARKDKSKKRIAAELVERSKQQSIALVPKPIARLALRFFPIFNPALFPHKPPPLSVANRVLFTDAEDGLLARGIMEHNTDWKEIQRKYLPSKTPHQIFVRQKNLACSRAPENPVKAVRRMKNAPLTPQETALIEEGLKFFKMDWTAIGKCMVPYRDPSLLSRQYRTAVGKQKSYKGDELKREKRRLYESQRRKSKALNSPAAGQNREGSSTVEKANPRCRTVSDKENCSADNAGGENNSGDDGGNNEDVAYVHEAFLADWRPAQPSLGDNQPVELFTRNRSINPNTSAPAVAAIFRPSDIHPRRLVQLAPDLPPVNLPPTVRIMSQSAFTKFQDGASSKVRDNAVPTRTGQSDEQNSLRCSTSDAVDKGDSDLQMHPLLFQEPEDGNSLPYYPLHGSANSCSSFDFFSSNSPQLNLNVPLYSHQDQNTFNFFNNSLKSKEVTSSSAGVDFHPLLQRLDDAIIPHPPADSSTPHPTDDSAVPRSPIDLDLDISLSYSARKEKGRSGRESRTTETQPSRPQGLLEENGNDHDSADHSVGIRNDEIVMEQEELSDSEDEDVEESVEFECEEMTDSEGEGGSDSDHAENVQNEDVQDEPRVRETSTSNMANDKRGPFSLFGMNLNAKPPVTRKSRNSHANRSSKNTTLSQPRSGTATQTKKPRKRAQKLNPK